MLRNKVMTVLTTAVMTTSALASAEILPILGDSYTANLAAAITMGQVNYNDSDIDAVSSTGIEIGFDCPLLKIENKLIRQRVSIYTTDNDGSKSLNVELNPHLMIINKDKYTIGAGPSLGFSKLTNDSFDYETTIFNYGLGVSSRYNIKSNVFVGAEATMTWTDNDVDTDNTRVFGKVGYQF